MQSCFRYQNATGKRPEDHSQMMEQTRGHVALGGGGLALFGSGCLYSWPEKLEELDDCLQDLTPVDWHSVMDDSGYRYNG